MINGSGREGGVFPSVKRKGGQGFLGSCHRSLCVSYLCTWGTVLLLQIIYTQKHASVTWGFQLICLNISLYPSRYFYTVHFEMEDSNQLSSGIPKMTFRVFFFYSFFFFSVILKFFIFENAKIKSFQFCSILFSSNFEN